MQQKFSLSPVISILKKSDIVSKIEIIYADEIAERSTYKVHCHLIPSKYKLEIRFVQTEKEFLYSYQLFTDKPIIRWDNAPHYPDLKTYPHHFHTKDGIIIESELNGIAIEDLQSVLIMIKEVIIKNDG